MNYEITNNLDNLIQFFDKQKKISNKKDKGLFELHSDNPFTKTIHNSKGFDVYEFENLMRNELIKSYKNSLNYKRPYISVTELISCVRKIYYTRLNYDINIEKQYQFSYLYLINKVGNLLHETIQSLYPHTEVEKTIISKEFNVKGRIDGIRDNFLLEYKTIDDSKFQNKYVEDHYIQSLIYAYILNHEYDYKIDTITIVYINRNLKKIIPFDLELDDKKALKYLNRSKIILSSIKNKIIPDKIGFNKEQCKYCQYVKLCSNSNKKDISQSVFLL